MKIRNGFVSNSSSSSFVLVMTKEAYDREFQKLSPLDQATAEATFREVKAFGKQCMLYDEATGMGGCYWFDNLDRSGIVERAKELAAEQGRPVIDLEALELDGNIEDYNLEDYVDYYEIHCAFSGVSDDESFDHSMDW